MFMLFLFLAWMPQIVLGQDTSIQERVDAAKPGEVIELPSGEFEENIVIDKSIHVKGTQHTIITSPSNDPVITIQGNDGTIEGLHIIQANEHVDAPALLLEGNNNLLTDLQVETGSVGIQLNQADNNMLSNVTITGDSNKTITERKHGIDLFASNSNSILHTTIHHVQDGIYIEKSHDTKVMNNTVFKSRYGYHLMFTKGTHLEENKSYENISGMMVMGAEGTVVHKNLLRNNQENIRSLGLLIFDTTDAVITENSITNNRIGIFIEDASNNALTNNLIKENYIGLQFKGAENNTISQNTLAANIAQGQATNSSHNMTDANFWGDHMGVDVSGDGYSDFSYAIDPFFLNITNEFPPFQLLFQSPGMTFLESLIHTPVEKQLIDHSPLLTSPWNDSEDPISGQWIVGIVCIILFIGSISIIYMGVKTNEKV